MRFGVDYYPEQWPKSRWDQDIRLMREAGVNTVRLGEFAWSIFEPEEGRFEFGLFDEVIEKLAGAGIAVILGTPTATPPAWLVAKDPTVLLVRQDGRRVSFGGRREYCFSHQGYREHSLLVVRALADHYGHDPRIIGWQIDNELGHEGSDQCFCEICRGEFANWLKRKYGTLDALNEALGAVFWNQTYSAWDQIPLPWPTIGQHNPLLRLEHRRFAASQVTSFLKMQVEVLRQRTSGQFVTHNFIQPGPAIDQPAMARELDIVGFDNYPVWGESSEAPEAWQPALALDFARGFANRPFWIIEQLIGAQGWDVLGYLPRPGQARLWAAQALGHGAEALIFFRWRSAVFGTEEFCHGVLNHDASPGRRYEEFKAIGKLVKEFEQLAVPGSAGTPEAGRVAFGWWPDNLWAWQIQPQSRSFSFQKEFGRFYQAFFALGAEIDLLPDDRLWQGRKLVVSPVPMLMRQEQKEALRSFVERGGVVVAGFRVGVKDESNRVVESALPGGLEDVFGVKVDDYEALDARQTVNLHLANGDVGAGSVWCDYLLPTTAEILAAYAGGARPGLGAVTINRFGKGLAYYVGTALDEKTFSFIAKEAMIRAGLEPFVLPPGVEVRRLALASRSGLPVYMVMNHKPDEVAVNVPGYGEVVGEPYGVQFVGA